MSLCATSALKIAQKLAAASIVSDSELTDHDIDKEVIQAFLLTHFLAKRQSR
jgi:hypothetical protein